MQLPTDVSAVPVNYVTAVYIPDTVRSPKHQPGKLVYSAQFDAEKLKCLYLAMYFPFFCNVGDLVEQSSLDVYTNGVHIVRPDSCGYDCLLPCRAPIGTFRYFDQGTFDEPATTGRVLPICGCLQLLGFLGFFGEQTNLHNTFINTLKPSCLGHITAGCMCIKTCESIYALREGEGARLAGIINEQVRLFKANPTNFGLDPVAQSSGVKMV